ncbi:CBS domain protein, putative [Medicago truncatula]|uniref:CBS domain protein, putative n=1 Tax=Medicago truncatula TaxID=3880 RepID=G7L7N4_MEDTR|nr:CBS domain protein, putative [Medicago truncatula]
MSFVGSMLIRWLQPMFMSGCSKVTIDDMSEGLLEDCAEVVKANSIQGERTVKKLHSSKALTISEGISVSDACRRMAARRVDAVLLTDANGLLFGIMTDKIRWLLMLIKRWSMVGFIPTVNT